MRNFLFMSLIFCFSLHFAANASACNPITDNCSTVSEFSNWTINYGDGEHQITPSGSQLDLYVSGTATSEGFAQIRYNADTPIGIMATFDINNINGSRVGIRKYVGTWENNYVEAQAYINKSSDYQLHITYRVRIQDTNNNTDKVLTLGEIGGVNNYPAFSGITIALARVDNEVWFWADGFDTVIKWKPTKVMGNINIKPAWKNAEKVGIDGYCSEGTENHTRATVRNVTLLFNPTSTNCIPLSDNLDINIPCAEFYGNKYGFTLNYSPLSNDPLYWKMDINSFTVK